MALAKATVKSAIKSSLQATYNTPAEGLGELDKFADGLADALITILTTQMEVKTSGSIPAAGIVAPNGPCTGAATATNLVGVVT